MHQFTYLGCPLANHNFFPLLKKCTGGQSVSGQNYKQNLVLKICKSFFSSKRGFLAIEKKEPYCLGIEFTKNLVIARGKPFSNYSKGKVKGVSDLKACLDYSNHHPRSCEKTAIRTKKLV